MNHGIDSTRSQRKHEQIYRDVCRFRFKESNRQIIPYSRKPTSRHPPPCTPQNEAVLPTLHPPLPENLLHTFRQILPSLPKAPFEHDTSPSTKKKATPPSFFTAVQGKYQHPPIHGVALRRAGGKFKLAFWKSSRLAKGSSDLASEQYMSLNF